MKPKKLSIRQLSVVMVLCLMVLTPMVAVAGNLNPGVIPPGSKPHGLTYGDWSKKWWQWALSIPATNNPLTDTTGEFCNVGQSGSVWFLAGTVGGSATRTCNIPAGKTIFLPIINTFASEEGSVNDMRTALASQMDNVTTMKFVLDGVPLQNLFDYRTQSPVFAINLPDNNIFQAPSGKYTPSVADGYYLMLAPLTPGKHRIDFSGSSPSISLDVHYSINVR